MKANLKFCIVVLFLSSIAKNSFAQSSMIVQAGTEVKLSTLDFVVLEDAHLVNDGIINLSSGNGTFKFSGVINTNISGTSRPRFNNIHLAKSGSAQLVLQRDIDTWGEILFTSGYLHLNNHIIDLGKFGYLNSENENSRIIGPAGGYVQWADVLDGPVNVNPGNLGLYLTTTKNLGNTVIRRGHQSQVNAAGGGSSILRYFDITPTSNTNLNATLRMTYFDGELNLLPEATLELWKSSNLINWTKIGYDSRNTTTNYVEKTGIADFSRWTLSSPFNALPVRFGAVAVSCQDNNAVIRWTTETEINSDHFEIQRSVPTGTWITIGSIAAAGNSNSTMHYSFTDINAVSNAFYRIVEFDLDGRSDYSTVARSGCSENVGFKLWPNPSRGLSYLSVNVASNGKVSLRIIDSKGAIVSLETKDLFQGNNILTLETRKLNPGLYTVQLLMGNESRSIVLVKM